MGREDSELRGRMIFVVGARRSGTNWLERILTAHPGVVAMPSETYLFSHGIAPLAERFQHANPGSPAIGRTFIERARFLDAVRDLLDTVFSEHAHRAGTEARYLLERTPWHASHLGLIADVYPDARVVHMVRDGRAVARSLLAMDWGPTSMADAAREWRRAVTDARAGGQAFGDRYVEVGYERLLAEPRPRIEELFAWLALDPPHQGWERILMEAASEFNVDRSSPGIGIDKWRHELSIGEIRTFERIAGADLEAFGYRRSSEAGRARRALRGRLAALPPGRVRYAAARWRPQPAARELLARAQRRRAKRVREDKHGVVELFERTIAAGRFDDALEMLTPRAQVRIVDGGEELAGRGDGTARALLARLEQHLSIGMRPLSGRLHASPGLLTSVIVYELADGSRWARTLVLRVSFPMISGVSMYRFRLEAGGAPGLRRSRTADVEGTRAAPARGAERDQLHGVAAAR